MVDRHLFDDADLVCRDGAAFAPCGGLQTLKGLSPRNFSGQTGRLQRGMACCLEFSGGTYSLPNEFQGREWQT